MYGRDTVDYVENILPELNKKLLNAFKANGVEFDPKGEYKIYAHGVYIVNVKTQNDVSKISTALSSLGIEAGGMDGNTTGTAGKVIDLGMNSAVAGGQNSVLGALLLTESKKCFEAGTLILMESDYKKIEDIKIGDYVYSYNEETKKSELKKVLKIFVNITEKIYRITIDNETIGVTGEHPFYVKGEWKEAKNLKLNDEIFSYFGNEGKVIKISIEVKNIQVYNFEVEDNHNYYIGQLSLLAHNSCKETKHGDYRIETRKFSESKIADIKSNYSHKVYQSGGRTVFAKKTGNFYDVIILNEKGTVITAVGGSDRSLRTWKDVTKMLNNNGGYSSLPW